MAEKTKLTITSDITNAIIDVRQIAALFREDCTVTIVFVGGAKYRIIFVDAERAKEMYCVYDEMQTKLKE